MTGPILGFLTLILFFISIAGLFLKTWLLFWIFLILTVISLTLFAVINFQSFVHFFVSRQLRYGTNVALGILGVIGIAIFLNVIIVQRLDIKADLTKFQLNSLPVQTKDIIKTLDKRINIIAFYKDENSPLANTAKEMLDLYQRESKLINVSFKNPDIETLLVDTYDLRYNGTIVFDAIDRFEKITTLDHQKFTSALLKLIKNKTENIYFLTEHEEHGIDNYGPTGYMNLRKDLETHNYKIQTLSLLKKTDIPADCDVLVIAGPKNPLTTNEIKAIDRYLKRKGKLLLLLNPSPSPEDVNRKLVQLMGKWGVAIGNDLVIDRQQFFPQTSELFVAPVLELQMHDITQFSMGTSIPFVYIRSVTPLENIESDLAVKSLVKTVSPTEVSWGETQRKTDGTFNTDTYTPGVDTPGPVSVAVAVEQQKDSNTLSENIDSSTRIVVYGDSDFGSNAFLRQPNSDLFLASINWLTFKKDLITIPPNNPKNQALQQVNVQQMRVVLLTSIFLIPLIILTTGMLVWWRRRVGGAA